MQRSNSYIYIIVLATLGAYSQPASAMSESTAAKPASRPSTPPAAPAGSQVESKLNADTVPQTACIACLKPLEFGVQGKPGQRTGCLWLCNHAAHFRCIGQGQPIQERRKNIEYIHKDLTIPDPENPKETREKNSLEFECPVCLETRKEKGTIIIPACGHMNCAYCWFALDKSKGGEACGVCRGATTLQSRYRERGKRGTGAPSASPEIARRLAGESRYRYEAGEIIPEIAQTELAHKTCQLCRNVNIASPASRPAASESALLSAPSVPASSAASLSRVSASQSDVVDKGDSKVNAERAEEERKRKEALEAQIEAQVAADMKKELEAAEAQGAARCVYCNEEIATEAEARQSLDKLFMCPRFSGQYHAVHNKCAPAMAREGWCIECNRGLSNTEEARLDAKIAKEKRETEAARRGDAGLLATYRAEREALDRKVQTERTKRAGKSGAARASAPAQTPGERYAASMGMTRQELANMMGLTVAQLETECAAGRIG